MCIFIYIHVSICIPVYMIWTAVITHRTRVSNIRVLVCIDWFIKMYRYTFLSIYDWKRCHHPQNIFWIYIEYILWEIRIYSVGDANIWQQRFWQEHINIEHAKHRRWQALPALSVWQCPLYCHRRWQALAQALPWQYIVNTGGIATGAASNASCIFCEK